MITDAPTQDPRSTRSGHGGGGVPAAPVVRILFHSDLRRVGAATLEDAFGAGSLSIGRNEPPFASRDGQFAPLADPCISRAQLRVTWRAETGTFGVEPSTTARRRVFVGSERRPARPGVQWPPGTLVEIEDRVLLWLDYALTGPADSDPLGMVGESLAMRRLRDRIRVLAPTETSVLVRGETGTGKELIVRALHALGPRPDAPLVALNCGALPEHLAESELFGHERGAFTGADKARAGFFESAGAGTLFLDELGELPLAIQAGLLRVLQERRVRRVGGSTEREVKARIIGATHRDLAADVAAGRFREDLYARLERPEIVAPPLRERVEDVPLLLAAFLSAERARFGAASPLLALWLPPTVERSPLPCGYVRSLLSHRWPRNVREVFKLAEELALRLDAGERIDASEVAMPPMSDSPPPPDAGANAGRTDIASDSLCDDAGRPDGATVAAILRAHDYRTASAARALGVARNTLYAWMRDLGLPRATDYARADLEVALAEADGDLANAARALRLSVRAFRLRLAQVGLSSSD